MNAASIKPSRLLYLIPVLVLLVGHIVLAVNMLKFRDAFQQSAAQDLEKGIAIPGKSAIVVIEPGNYSLFYFGKRELDTEDVVYPDKRNLKIKIINRRTGKPVSLKKPAFGRMYISDPVYRGAELWTCDITQPGTYNVITSYPDGGQDDIFKIKIERESRGNLGRMFGAMWTGVPICLITYFLAAGLIAWIFLARKKARQRILDEEGAS